MHGRTKQKGADKTAPYYTIESEKEEKCSDTITEKKIEKEVAEILERMGNYMGRICSVTRGNVYNYVTILIKNILCIFWNLTIDIAICR